MKSAAGSIHLPKWVIAFAFLAKYPSRASDKTAKRIRNPVIQFHSG
jgi:hypothetical protein